MPTPEGIEQSINAKVNVTRVMVTVAKAFILKNFDMFTERMQVAFLQHMGAQPISELVIHNSVALEPQIDVTAKWISCQLAFAEALWALIHQGVIHFKQDNLRDIRPKQSWTTVVKGRGGNSGGWNFNDTWIVVPSIIRLAPSANGQPPQPLSDDDLYLQELNITDLHPGIEEFLRQAVQCFRHELYLPCLAMLASASEGAWIELGYSLLKVDPTNPNLTPKQRDEYRDILTSPGASIVKKMEVVVQLYDRQDIFGAVKQNSGYGPDQLKQVSLWSHVVRDARNAVHYGSDPAIEYHYENVAALLLGAHMSFRVLYAIHRAAERLATVSSGP
jgi:hypothetical protein